MASTKGLRTMKSICLVAASGIMALLAGCGDKTFSDAEAFVEKYVREDIAQTLGGFDEKWGFSGVEFSGVRSELVQSFAGTLEKITCEVTLVPKTGASHYIPIAWQVATEDDRRKLSDSLRGGPDERSVVTSVVSMVRVESLRRRAEAVKESLIPNLRFNTAKPPVCVKVENFKDMMTATVYRAKDDNGVFRPVRKDAMQQSLVMYDSKLRFDNLVTEKRLAELGGVVSGSEGCHSVQAAFSENVRKFADLYGAFAQSCREYETACTPRRERDLYETARRQRLYPAQQEAERLISAAKTRFVRVQQSAKNRANVIPRVERSRDNANHDVENAQNGLERAEMARVAAEQRLAAAKEKYQETGVQVRLAGKNLRQAKSKVIDWEKKVEKMKALAESAEADVGKARNACEAANAELA